MSDDSSTPSPLLDRLARAIAETRDLPSNSGIEFILIQLEDVEARLRAHETLDYAYRKSLSFDVIAVRELDDVDESHGPYLELLSELAADLTKATPF